MRKLLKKFDSFIMALGEVLVGILLLVDPVRFTTAIIIGVGILLAVYGGLSVYAYFRSAPEEAARGQDLTKGLCVLAGAAFCIFRSEWFSMTFPLLTMLYGVGILVTGLAKVQWAVDMLRMKMKLWYFPAAGAALTLIVAGVIIQNPFETTEILWTFAGIALIVEAVVDLLGLVYEGKGPEGYIRGVKEDAQNSRAVSEKDS